MRLLKLFRIPFFAAVLIALGAMLAGAWLTTALAMLAAGGVFVLGRDPVHDVPSRPLGVVSPVDGRITVVDEREDPFLARPSLVVRMRQGVFAPAVLHSPIEGRVQHIWCGHSMPATDDGAVVAIHVSTDEGDDVVFSLSRPWLPGPLSWSVQPGERVGQGLRKGLAGWGRHVSIYMPPGSMPEVQLQDRVRAGVDVISRLEHSV